MISLLLAVATLVLVYLTLGKSPFLAGLIAVIPVKIVGTTMMAVETGSKTQVTEAIKGMLIGQFVWGLILLAVYIGLTR